MVISGTLTCPRCGRETAWPMRCDCPSPAAQQPEAPTLADDLVAQLKRLADIASAVQGWRTEVGAGTLDKAAARIESDATDVRILKSVIEDLKGRYAASRERERGAYERAAKLCSDAEDKWSNSKLGYLNEYEQGRVNCASELAAAIRELATPDSAASPTGEAK